MPTIITTRSPFRSPSRRATLAAFVAASALAGCTEPDDDDLGTAELGLGQVCVRITEGVDGGVVDDTYVSAARRNHNFDDSPFGLFVRPDGPNVAVTLLRPHLDLIPAGARIESAILAVHDNLVMSRLQLAAHPITAPWSEQTVTYASLNHAYAGLGIPASQLRPEAPYRFDLTALVTRWFRGVTPNHGVALTTVSRPALLLDEHHAEANRPTLTVCYTTCSDGAQNGDETGVDCGGASCSGCVIDDDGDGAPSTTDCNDHDPAIHPGAPERCNQRDDDCDGHIDEGNVCAAPAEVCDGLDNDGDGVVDDGAPGSFVDCSHYISFNPADPTEIGGRWYGYTSCTAGAVECLPVTDLEACDGLDNDHDGQVDEAGVLCRDADEDGAGSPLDQLPGCAPVPGYSSSCGDCDDTAPEINPDGWLEPCESERIYADNNCDGIFDRNRNDCA